MIVAAPPVEYHEGCMTTREDVSSWVDRYEAAWRAPGTEALRDVFAEDASYQQGPTTSGSSASTPSPRCGTASARAPTSCSRCRPRPWRWKATPPSSAPRSSTAIRRCASTATCGSSASTRPGTASPSRNGRSGPASRSTRTSLHPWPREADGRGCEHDELGRRTEHHLPLPQRYARSGDLGRLAQPTRPPGPLRSSGTQPVDARGAAAGERRGFVVRRLARPADRRPVEPSQAVPVLHQVPVLVPARVLAPRRAL